MTAPRGAPASITVGPVMTEYLRVGTGAPVLVLDAALAAAVDRGDVPPRWRGHRLIVPLRTVTASLAPPPAGTPSFDGWLAGLLEGLGLEDVTIIAAAPYEMAARRYAERSPADVRVVDGDRDP